MPVMPRPSGKARQIAYAILGIPDNLRKKRLSKRDKRIYRENTRYDRGGL